MKIKHNSAIIKEVRVTVLLYLSLIVFVVIVVILLAWNGKYVKTINTTAEIADAKMSEQYTVVSLYCSDLDIYLRIKNDRFFSMYAYYNIGDVLSVSVAEYNKFGKKIYAVLDTEFSKDNLRVELIREDNEDI